MAEISQAEAVFGLVPANSLSASSLPADKSDSWELGEGEWGENAADKAEVRRCFTVKSEQYISLCVSCTGLTLSKLFGFISQWRSISATFLLLLTIVCDVTLHFHSQTCHICCGQMVPIKGTPSSTFAWLGHVLVFFVNLPDWKCRKVKVPKHCYSCEITAHCHRTYMIVHGKIWSSVWWRSGSW